MRMWILYRTNFRTISYAGAIVALYVGLSYAGSVSSLDAFRSGKYAIPLGHEAKPDPEAKKRVTEFSQLTKMEKKLRKQKASVVGSPSSLDQLPEEVYTLQELEECNKLLTLCEATRGTESGPTAVLLLAGTANQWSNKTKTPAVEDALKELRKRFPDTWQSRVAPLLKAQLVVRKRTSTRNVKKTNVKNAIQILRDNLPPKDYNIDATDAEVTAVTNVFKIAFPLRAAYLVSIAQIEYNLGSSGDLVFLNQAGSTCVQIVEEYPDTPHAEWARDIADRRIPVLKEMMGAQ